MCRANIYMYVCVCERERERERKRERERDFKRLEYRIQSINWMF